MLEATRYRVRRVTSAFQDPKKRGSKETTRRFDVFARGVCITHGIQNFGEKIIPKSSGELMPQAVERGFAPEFEAFKEQHQNCHLSGFQFQARVSNLWLSSNGAGTWHIDTELNKVGFASESDGYKQ